MRPTSYQSEDLDRLLRKHKIAALDDLKAVLGTDVDSTVFRKLNELAYRTSYSHRGCPFHKLELREISELPAIRMLGSPHAEVDPIF